ncbi:hypothetical protein FH972_020959 [Carpinus fangiana]|uniref:gamma-glutamylcyclotransferase n=1 Tax=Carpinus fangiana TaxID=176857 RepID=A0A5N6KMY7_9ROSI|nr:hypothetical protein FH972_020959 [Carpinus fangiana]
MAHPSNQAVGDPTDPTPSKSCAALKRAASSFLPRLTPKPILNPAASAVTTPAVERALSHFAEHAGDSSTTLPAGKTVFYLAYGSNLAAETFLGRRAIKPISSVNVAVPALRLTFDLPGIPYTEPCFANTALRDPIHPDRDTLNEEHPLSSNEKSPLLAKRNAKGHKDPYHKDRWHKPLVGVVYELTPSDYAHVFATEGGGASYQDVQVDCYPLSPSTSGPGHTIPMNPTGPHFKAHTLFAPSGKGSGRRSRPDPAYAQPSRRYLDLIMTGASEHNLPQEYRAYLAQIRSFTITTVRQRLGQVLFNTVWVPVFMALFALQPLFSRKNGQSPAWLVRLTNALFAAVWISYDRFFEPLFGDGERSLWNEEMGPDDHDDYDFDMEKATSQNSRDEATPPHL